MTEYSKLCIFDLDGVLIDSRELHFNALNLALAEGASNWVISKEEHLSTYDGLSTKRKLELLTLNKGIPEEYYDRIWGRKQEWTEILLQDLEPSLKLQGIFDYLKYDENFKIAVASNAITKTVKAAINGLALDEYVDIIQSNELVIRSKPYPEMYWNAMMLANAVPSTTMIIEDSHIGRQGAIESGATLIPVENPQDLSIEKIAAGVAQLNGKKRNIPWRDSKLNVLIPMAGLGSRFAQAGFTFPKPLIEVNGKPMIQVVVENLNIEANFIYIVQAEHYYKYNLSSFLHLLTPKCKIVVIDGLTEGAAVTTLKAEQYINNDEHLLIANSDQFIEWNSNEVMYAFAADQIDAGILTFKSIHPKWSFAKLDENGFVSEVAEKNPISDNATVGIYYWNKGSDYVKYAKQMIDKNIRTNNEFYVAPVFNEAIADGKKIRMKEVAGMHGLGTPEDLQAFLEWSKK